MSTQACSRAATKSIRPHLAHELRNHCEPNGSVGVRREQSGGTRWCSSCRHGRLRAATGRSAKGRGSRLSSGRVRRTDSGGRGGRQQGCCADEDDTAGNRHWNRWEGEQPSVHPHRKRARDLRVVVVLRHLRHPKRRDQLVVRFVGRFRASCAMVFSVVVSDIAGVIVRVPVQERQAGRGNPGQHGDRQCSDTRSERAAHESNVRRDSGRGNTAPTPLHFAVGKYRHRS